MRLRATRMSLGSFPKYPLLLDNLSAVVAFSLRKLRNSYTGSAIRVRRSSDNTEQDIGFKTYLPERAARLNEEDLLSFAGANSVFVTTWYDQSGNARNAVQASASLQPRIVNAGVLETLNGRVALKFLEATPMSMDANFGSVIDFNSIHVHGVFKSELFSSRVLFQLSSGATQFFDDLNIDGFGWRMRNNVGADSGAISLATNTDQHVGYWGWDGSSVYLSHDNAAPSTASAPSGICSHSVLRIGHHNAGSSVWTHVGNMQELVGFERSLAVPERSILARNAGAYYNITVA